MTTPAPPKPPFVRRAWLAVRRRIVPYSILYVLVVGGFMWFENTLVFRACTAAESWRAPHDMVAEVLATPRLQYVVVTTREHRSADP